MAFELERLGHHGDRQDAHLASNLCDDRRRAGTGSTTHAGGDEEHVRTLDHLLDAISILHCGLAADLGIRACAESLGYIAADLQRGLHPRAVQRLGIGVGADEIHALDSTRDHVLDSISSAASDTQHFYDCILAISVHQLEH